MSSKSDSNSNTEQNIGIPVQLTLTNYAKWLEAAQTTCGERFGFQASVLRTNVQYIEPFVDVDDYTPPAVIGVPPLPAARLAALREKAEERRLSSTAAMKKESPKFYNCLMKSFSVGSTVIIKKHIDFPAAEISANPVALFAIVRYTHLTNVSGGGPLMVDHEEEMKEREFNLFLQTETMDLSTFYKMYTDYRTMLTSMHVTAPTGPREAQKFLMKLDRKRHGAMILHMENAAIMGTPYPQTLADAYQTAACWKVDKAGGSNGGEHTTNLDQTSSYLLADETGEQQRRKRPRTGERSAAGKGGRGTGRGNGAVPGRGGRGVTTRSSKAKSAKSDNAPKKQDTSGWNVPEGCEPDSRTCRGCLKKGHIYPNCPDNPLNGGSGDALVIVQGEETEDEEQEDCAFMLKTDLLEDDQHVLFFAENEILLDNQASQAIFRNAELLHSLRERTPYKMGGIDSTQKGLLIEQTGSMLGLRKIDGSIGIASSASANVLAQARLIDAGYSVKFDDAADSYTVETDIGAMCFTRRRLRNGKLSPHYSHLLEQSGSRLNLVSNETKEVALVETVSENIRRYTKREVKSARAARSLMEKLGHASLQSTIKAVNRGIMNCEVTATDLRNAEAIFGRSAAAMKGKTNMKASVISKTVLAARTVQVQQRLAVDIMFVMGMPFLIGLLYPLELGLVVELSNRSADEIAPKIKSFIATAASRGFDVLEVHTDGEKAIGTMKTELQSRGVEIEPSGPKQHIPQVEKLIQTIKKRVRAHRHSLPFTMGRELTTKCVKFCMSRRNMVASANSMDHSSPLEQFSGRKLDAKLDFRVAFGDYVQATNPDKTNSVKDANTHGCIAALPLGDSRGTVRMWRISTRSFVNRNQFVILPMPDEVITLLNAIAKKDGFTRDEETREEASLGEDEDAVVENIPRNQATMQQIPHPDMLPADHTDPLGAGVESEEDEAEVAVPHETDLRINEEKQGVPIPIPQANWVRRSTRNIEGSKGSSTVMVSTACQERHPNLLSLNENSPPPEPSASIANGIGTQLRRRAQWHDKQYMFKMSVKSAMRDRPEEARAVIMAEIKQMVDKKVWHGVHLEALSRKERKAIIRSSMFLKDKYFASGEFEKFKARLVAGGDQQDKTLYEDLAAPTVATAHVFTIAGLAAKEGRTVVTIDIGGAYLNADMASSGVTVHMQLDATMTAILVKVDPSFEKFVKEDGSSIVQLDKALYGCVEAAHLWHNMLRGVLEGYGLEANPTEPCLFNRVGSKNYQLSVALHVDDLMVTCACKEEINLFAEYLKRCFQKITVHEGVKLSYLGMLFDFSGDGEVKVTMDKCVEDILRESGVEKRRSTPATAALFNTRETIKATPDEAKWFHTNTAKMLYLAKRVRPECLTAVSFLTTRVLCCDVDDLAKLRRLLGYLLLTRERGIVIRIGDTIQIKVYIDAAYGVHLDTGRSHGGTFIVVGEAGPVFAKSGKQHNVTKSSTEAELVALSDHAGRGIHLRNFLVAQGYKVGPVLILQDNRSCMAIMARGGPTSERSRHINIRYFWLKERIDSGEVVLEHLGTELMFANILTKPVQGKQFAKERKGLTNWWEEMDNIND